MTLKEYRSNPALVQYAQGLFASKKFQQLLEAVRNEHPKNYRTNVRGLPESDHAINLGRVYGFDEFDNTLMSTAMPEIPENQTLEATFPPPLTEEER
jgi:hypothetical protein